MKIRRLAILSFLGLMMLLSGAYATRAQNVVVFEPGRYRVNYRNYRTDQRGATLLREAVRRYGAHAFQTAFVGDQSDDLKAAFRAGCRRVLVRTGLGLKTLERGIADYLQPVAVFDDLAAAIEAELRYGTFPSAVPISPG